MGQSYGGNDNVWTFVELPGGALTISRRYLLPGAPSGSAFLLRTDCPYGIGYNSTGYDTVVASPFEDDFPNKFQWDIVDVSAPVPGVFRIMNVNSGKALTASPDNNEVAQLPMWYLANQEWTFSDYTADGYLFIINRNLGQVLEIGGGGDLTQPSRTANVWDGWGGPNQQWQLQDLSGFQISVQDLFTTGAACRIINRNSGLALEIGGNDLTSDGRRANQWYYWGGLNQQWNIYIDSSYRGSGKPDLAAASDAAPGTLTLYPNPASTALHLALPGNREAVQVTITDAQGRTTPVSSQQGNVDVSTLAPGLYIVSAGDGQKTFRQKFVKE